MKSLLSFADRIDALNRAFGKFFSWAVLLMTLLTFAIVVLRYGFDVGKIWMQEIVLYLHGMFFMSLAGYTLSENGHVRVDVLYGSRSEKFKLRVDLFGNLLLLMPTCLMVLYYSAEYVLDSWAVLETSSQPGGLPLVFALKTFLPIFGGLLLLQSFAQLVKSLSKLAAEKGGEVG